MNKSRKASTLEEYKIQASILLKSLKGKDAAKAVKRLKRLPEYANLSTAEILQRDIKRKHALLLIAFENGFGSWLDLKMQINFIVGGYLNPWFANYNEAKTHLKATGGFLLPYKKQFFICEADYMKHIGFNPDDPDWLLIGYDWAVPEDTKAWQRLYKNWSQSKGGRHG
ncbi:MAG: hypothetical protein K2Y18_07120 [Alphaproteobacteria bacterium]|nr:hypothetical protein [Alphaproteobacteria bacterium]